jgi:ferrochelatase
MSKFFFSIFFFFFCFFRLFSFCWSALWGGRAFVSSEMDKRPNTKFAHGEETPSLGVVITNLGSPASPTASGLRWFYAEFLSDRRVIEVARLLWYCILWLFILPFRPFVVKKLYQSIWLPQGSPIIVLSEQLKTKLATQIDLRFGKGKVKLALGMRYGTPSMDGALEELKQSHIARLLVFPLYPQAAAATTASTFDAVADSLRKWRYVPHFRMIMGYHDDERYIRTLAHSINRFWRQKETSALPDLLVFSFHGVPRKTLDAGDPYHCFCLKTARLTAEALGLTYYDPHEEGCWTEVSNTPNVAVVGEGKVKTKFAVTFQSRFLFAEWVKPYSAEMMTKFPKLGYKSVDVIAPAFSVDCLETLEEIQVQLAETFEEHGGERFRYIPCLNDDDEAVEVYLDLIEKNMQGWPEAEKDEFQKPVRSVSERACTRSKQLGWVPRNSDVELARKNK